MANILCKGCNQHKKEEHFSVAAIARENPTCSSCDIKALLRKVELVKKDVVNMNRQQQIVKEVTEVIEKVKSPNLKEKKTSRDFIESILAGGA